MESMATDLAKMPLEKLMDKGIAESRYVCCFTSIADDFEKERKRLEAKTTTMEKRVEVATGRGEVTPSDVTFWQEEANKLLQEDTKIRKTCFFGLCPDLKWRYSRGKELAKKTGDITRLLNDNFECVGLPVRLPGVEYRSSQDYISFKSRELKYKQLRDALKDDNNYMTGLQGMGGTGKTTLAIEIGKELKQSKQFDLVIIATVSSTPVVKEIQDKIAGPLGLSFTESDRPGLLWSRLMNGEKILVILDDVWVPIINFEEIGIPSRDNHRGCRVLVTTRDLRVCNKMKCGRIIQLELLSEEDAWSMFQRHADTSDSSPKSLLDQGLKILNECKGLPVAIAAIASSLKGQQSWEEWDVALQSLQKPVSTIRGVDDDNFLQIYKCLKFSYDNMKDERAKGLFLLCSVFREDEEIPPETLTRLGIGSRLFGDDYDIYNDARSQVAVARNKLLDSCLLLKGDEGNVKMHDLVHEVAHLIANKEIRAVNLSNKSQKSMVEREKNVKYLLCEGKDVDVFSCRFDGSNLETLIVLVYMDEDTYCVEVPNSFIENITGIRVLHLSYNHNWEYPHRSLSLPQSIQSLMNIRSLLVDGIDLGDISILGNLRSLETLDLVECKIDELPCGITKLEKFRLLNLKMCEIKTNNPFEVIERCSSLEELYFIRSFNGLCREITFPALQRYHVSKLWTIANDSLTKCVSFIEIGDGDSFSEATIKYFMRTAEVLKLSGVHRGWTWRNLVPEIVPMDQGMSDLVELHLRHISQLQCLLDTKPFDSRVQNVFPKLVVLDLHAMDDLEVLCNGPHSFDSLKSLEELQIKRCRSLQNLFKCKLNLYNLKTMTLGECSMLVSLFQLSTLRSLVQLEELKITTCERLENIITDESIGEQSRDEIVDDDNNNKSCDSIFPKLKVLDIQKCPRLEFILPCLSAQDLPVLETIIIKYCDDLKYMFGQYQDVKLGSLKEIQLHELPKFINIFPECYLHPISLSKKKPSSIDGFKKQIQLDPIKCNIFSLTRISCFGHKYRHKLRSTTSTKLSLVSEDQQQDCSIKSALDSSCLHIWERAHCFSRQSQILRNIKEIELSYLKIKSVFILSIAPIMMLETLKIWDCGELNNIIDIEDDCGGKNWGNVFPNLKDLFVKDCRQLEYIFGHYTHDHQNHNEIHLHLPALKCLTLLNLPRLVGMCPKNYRTTLPLLTELKLKECSQVASKSIGDFIIHSVSRSLDSTTVKDLSENVEHFLALKYLEVDNSKAENIFCLGEINGQKLNLGLQQIQLYDLPHLTNLFVGPKNSFSLQNLTKMKIVRCGNLEIIFSSSISRCLPHLCSLVIVECKELKKIIQEGVENQKMSNSHSPRPCFPKLQTLVVANSNKLECVFSASICKELPELKHMMIIGADVLKEIFRCESDQEVEIPNIKSVVFVKLPSLCQAQGIQFQVAGNRFVQNCQQLSLTSTATDGNNIKFADFDLDHELRRYLKSLLIKSLEDSEIQNTSNENASAKTTEDFPIKPEVQAASGHELSSSKVNTNQSIQTNPPVDNHHENGIESNEFALVETKTKQRLDAKHEVVENVSGLATPSITISPANSEELSNEQLMGQICLMNQQQPLGDTDTSFKLSQGNNCLNEMEDRIIQKGSTLKKTVTTILSTNSETRNEPPIPLVSPIQKGINSSVEEGTTSINTKTKTLSTHSKSVGSSSGPLDTFEPKIFSQKDGDGQMVIHSFSIATTESLNTEEIDVEDSQKTTETIDLVSLDDHVGSIKVSPNIEEQFYKDDEIRVSEPKPYASIPSPVASYQSPSMHYKGNSTQIVEDSSFSSVVTKELEQLVSKKHLASENLSLLINFLVKYPSVRLTDNSLSNRYKGYAYNCLAELLKFLQSHSVLDVLGSSHSEFVELLQDVRRCAFDKDWLDDVERRTLFHSLQVSQDDLQKLLDSKQQVTREVEVLRLKIGILTQRVEDLKHQLTSSEAILEGIIQQESQFLEAMAASSVPIDY